MGCLRIVVASALAIALAGLSCEAFDAHFMVEVEKGYVNVTSTTTCAGALVSATHVVTVAHCIANDVRLMKVYSGTSKMWATGKDGELHEVSAARKHPKYKPINAATFYFLYDVGVVRLATSVKLGAQAAISVLPQAGESPKAGNKLQMSCWGYSFGDSPDDPDEQPVGVWTITVENPTKCSKQFGVDISSREFCVNGAPEVGQSGSAAFIHNKVYGVASWGSKVFTDLSNPELNSWVRSMMTL